VRGRTFVWFGSSALSVAVIYYCLAMLARFIQYLSAYSL
jgi:uncharacterized membrane protein YdfJ with MMPL/SSD domain